jgi:hypothetical protein
MTRTRPILLPLVLALYGLAILGTLALTVSARPTSWAPTGERSGAWTGSADARTAAAGWASGATSTPPPAPTPGLMTVLLATATPHPKTPDPTRAPYVWPSPTNEAAYGGLLIGDRP